MRHRIGNDVECIGEQSVAGEDRRRLVEGTVRRRTAAAEIVVIHGGEIVVDERIAVDHLERRAGTQRALVLRAEESRRLDHQERPQPFAAAERRVAHRLEEARRSHRFARQRIVRQQPIEHRFGRLRDIIEPLPKFTPRRLVRHPVPRSIRARLARSGRIGQGSARPMRALRKALRYLIFLCLGLLAVLVALIVLWRFVPPVSTLMAARWASFRGVERTYVPLARISPRLIAAVVTSEDGLFCRHHGVDWGALNEVISEADEEGPSRGASTITMQTAKNLFLWPQRSAIRKGLEIPLALVLDRAWGKRRVLEVYLNIAEWGDGLFGAEAAARRYFQKSAADLSQREASLLATALPNPISRDPSRPKRLQAVLAAINAGRAAKAEGYLRCVR